VLELAVGELLDDSRALDAERVPEGRLENEPPVMERLRVAAVGARGGKARRQRTRRVKGLLGFGVSRRPARRPSRSPDDTGRP
jgi:hypothetical protein